jgi:hypothetical protein
MENISVYFPSIYTASALSKQLESELLGEPRIPAKAPTHLMAMYNEGWLWQAIKVCVLGPKGNP